MNTCARRCAARLGRRAAGAALFAALLLPGLAAAALRVLACEPEWGALARELGGERVEVSVATTALQDPHRIQARPSLIARARNADLLACTGAGLESGWLPLLQQQSGNPSIQPGAPGAFEAADHVPMLEVPVRVDRAHGDVHAEGNPHLHLDARNIGLVAAALARRLAEIDPQGRDTYAQRHAAFDARWQAALARWQARAAPLKGLPVVVQHRSWPYLSAWLGLKEVQTLEPKQGIEPSVTHLQAVLAALRDRPARLILHAAYQDPRASQWLAARANLPVVTLPFTVGGTSGASDLVGLFDDTIDRLLRAAQ